MQPREILLAAFYLGAVGGYAVAKSGLDRKLIAAMESAADRRALRNAQIMLDEVEQRRVAVPVKATNAAAE
jgi:predicted ATP-dependent serine protease